MSILTANTLFHFTGSDKEKGKNALMNILGTGFRPTYSSEFGEESIGGTLKNLLIPMVCFCDLPLSKLDKHMNGYEWNYNGKDCSTKGYGEYGLGMSKDWAKSKLLNPVTYVNRSSFVLQAMGITVGQLFELNDEFSLKYLEQSNKGATAYSGQIEVKEGGLLKMNTPGVSATTMHPKEFTQMQQISNALSNALAVLAYMKPYQDFTTNQLYYDEREWRHIIPYTQQYAPKVPILTESDGKHYPLFPGHYQGHDIDHYRKIIEREFMLTFKPDDIKYIIVKSDDDIDDIIARLNELVGKGQYTRHEADRLYSRILTSERIKEDF